MLPQRVSHLNEIDLDKIQWQRNDGPDFHFNYRSESTLFRVSLNSKELLGLKKKGSRPIILIDALSPGDYRVFNQEGTLIKTFGLSSKKDSSSYPFLELEEDVVSNGENIYYFIREAKTRFDGRIFLTTKEELKKKEDFNFKIALLYIGAIFYVFVFNIGIYLLTKSKSALYYVLFNMSFGGAILIFTMFPSSLLGNNFIEEWLLLCGSGSGIFSVKMAEHFLDLPRLLPDWRRKIPHWISYYMGTGFFLMVVLPWSLKPFAASMIDLGVSFVCISIPLYSIWVYKRSPYAGIHLLGWSFQIAGVSLLYVYQYTGFFIGFDFIRYSLLAGSLIEVFVYSYGISYKVFLTEKESQESAFQARERTYYQTRLRILAHDIANPLMAALSFIRNAKENFSNKDKVIHHLERIDGVVSRVKRSEITHENSKGDVSLFECIEDLKRDLEGTLTSKNITINLKGDDIIIPMRKDVFVQSVLTNLVFNSIKFSPAGGVVEVWGEDNDVTTAIKIRDYGSGISSEQLDKINSNISFSEVGTCGEGGTGLGIRIVKEILAENNGNLFAEVMDPGSLFGVNFIKVPSHAT